LTSEKSTFPLSKTVQPFIINSLTEIENKTSAITLEINKVKEHAPDLQTFLSLPHLISKATYEEQNVEKLGSARQILLNVLN
jgi:hypothetical protein